MYLQGDLQTVFDALFHMGIIDPVLELDWGEAQEEFQLHLETFEKIVHVANSQQEDLQDLMAQLEAFDEQSLNYLAMEVAKEFADFHAREDLH